MGEELWYVKLANDDVHRVTLDQLDGAFQAGHIDESTMVLAAGAERWTRLGDLLGGDDSDEEGSTVTEAPAPAPVQAAPIAQPVAVRQVVPVQQPVQYAQPAVSYAPHPSMAPISRGPAMMPNTLRPMSIDMEDSDLDAPFKRKSKKGWVVAAIGLAAVAGGAGFVATRAQGGNSLVAAAAAAVMGSPAATTQAVAPPPPAPDPAPEPPPLPVAPPPSPASTTANAATGNTAPAEASPMNPQFTTRFNEDQKTKLLAADKDRAQKAKSHHAGGGGAPSHASSPSSSKSKSSTFTTTGNKYDPLNSSI